MAASSKAGFLAVPLKSSSEVDLIGPLSSFISNTYSSADKPENFKKQLAELQKLRQAATQKVHEFHEGSLEHLYRYYDQLNALEGKFPLTENQVIVPFKWKDAFDKGTFFSGRLSMSVSSGGFEKACILFNIAALQSQVAASQNPDGDEGLKKAAQFFKSSAGILSYLSKSALSLIQQDPTPDMSQECLSCLEQLMVAQAQESIGLKAITDKMKATTIAKVAMQCCDYYAEVLKMMQVPTLRNIWDKDWLPKVAGKQAMWHALGEYYESVGAGEKKIVGEQISRLRKAQELIKTAQQRAGESLDLSHQLTQVEAALKAAEKDNNFIYHERVPEHRTLPGVARAALAKPADMPATFSKNFQDLFESLVPLSVHQAMATFDTRRSEIVNTEIGRLKEATQLINGVLASYNLPAARRVPCRHLCLRHHRRSGQLGAQRSSCSSCSSASPVPGAAADASDAGLQPVRVRAGVWGSCSRVWRPWIQPLPGLSTAISSRWIPELPDRISSSVPSTAATVPLTAMATTLNQTSLLFLLCAFITFLHFCAVTKLVFRKY